MIDQDKFEMPKLAPIEPDKSQIQRFAAKKRQATIRRNIESGKQEVLPWWNKAIATEVKNRRRKGV